MTGVSLIPPVSLWPDSSLAQMVAWIAEVCEVRYASAHDLSALLNQSDGNVWIFGTAFHFVNWLDLNASPPSFPPHCLIETGGTKGRSRQVTRDYLYAQLAYRFGISTNQIVSEYGMCELASQAYDWISHRTTQTVRLENQCFRFRPEVSLAVFRGRGQIQRDGVGALVVKDSVRVDVSEPMVTEDLVALKPDGSFRLKGRVPRAPLKGCSSQVNLDRKLEPSERCDDHYDAHYDDRRDDSDGAGKIRGDIARAEKVEMLLRQLLSSSQAQDILSRDLGSASAATAILEDTLRSVPTSDGLRLAADASQCHYLKWAIILPNNHQLVGFYPLALAATLGLDVQLKLPTRGSSDLIRLFADELHEKVNARISYLPDRTQLSDGELDRDWPSILAGKGTEAVLCYGADETTRILQNWGLPTSAFGARVAISALTWPELSTDSQTARALIRDAFALAQKGCFSTRIVLLFGCNDHAAEISDRFRNLCQSAFGIFWGQELEVAQRIEQDYAYQHFRQTQPWQVGNVADELVIPIAAATLPPSPDEVVAAATPFPFALPTLTLATGRWQSHDLDDLLKRESVSQITLSPALLEQAPSDKVHFKIRSLGDGNRIPWDGRHEGRPLFSCFH